MLNKFYNYNLLAILLLFCACFSTALYAMDTKATVIAAPNTSFDPPFSITLINFYRAQLRQDPTFLFAMPTNYIDSVLSRLELIELVNLSKISERHKRIIKGYTSNFIWKDISGENLSAENILELGELFPENKIRMSPQQYISVMRLNLEKQLVKLSSAKL